jgi:hypothetical protein
VEDSGEQRKDGQGDKRIADTDNDEAERLSGRAVAT